MYQNNLHKNHKVVPLSRASRELVDETNRNINVLEHDVDVLDKLINRSHSNLLRSEK
jgi:hypothetical protein